MNSLAVHVEGKQNRTSFIDFTLLHSTFCSSSATSSFFPVYLHIPLPTTYYPYNPC